MKRIITLVMIGFMLLTSSLLGQSNVFDQLSAKSVLVEFENESFGSGFFYQDLKYFYLITAKHVILKENKNDKGEVVGFSLRGQKCLITYYPRNPDIADSKTLEVDLLGLYKQDLMRYSESADIIAFRVGLHDTIGYSKVNFYEKFITKRYEGASRLVCFYKGNILSFKKSNIGNDVYILGYPKALGLKSVPQYDFNRPLLRKGIVAGKNIQNQTIVVDCPAFGGNSGGPVVEAVVDYLKVEYKLIGIVISFIPMADVWYNPRYDIKNAEIINSGYSVIESSDKILDLIDTFE